MTTVREVRYTGDGLDLTGTLAIPDGPGPFPLVMIAHEGPGLDDIQRNRAGDVAKLGYVGFALDYHGPLSPFTDRQLMMDRLGELFADPDRTRALGLAALDAVRNDRQSTQRASLRSATASVQHSPLNSVGPAPT